MIEPPAAPAQDRPFYAGIRLMRHTAKTSYFIPDESDPKGMVSGMIGRLAPGSYLALSHVVSDEAKVRQQMTEVSLANTRDNFGRIRSRAEVRAFFDGLEPVEPGLVDIRDWRPDARGEEQADRWFVFGGVAASLTTGHDVVPQLHAAGRWRSSTDR